MNRLTQDDVTRRMTADPDTIYALVSDVTRTPSWSPEVVECRWLNGATHAMVGARFASTNRRKWFTWTNRPIVTEAEPGHRFTIERTEHGGGTMRWTYTLSPANPQPNTVSAIPRSGEGGTDSGADAGTDVTLSYLVVKPVPLMLHVILRLLLGCPDLQADLHRNIQTSLARIDELAEALARHPHSPCPTP